jgi:hypothetical protein
LPHVEKCLNARSVGGMGSRKKWMESWRDNLGPVWFQGNRIPDSLLTSHLKESTDEDEEGITCHSSSDESDDESDDEWEIFECHCST